MQPNSSHRCGYACTDAPASTVAQPEFEHTDREIDALVYELYGLSDKEIALVEAATS
jgi:DNA-binding CsgD family transcriptional regulator